MLLLVVFDLSLEFLVPAMIPHARMPAVFSSGIMPLDKYWLYTQAEYVPKVPVSTWFTAFLPI